MEFCPQAFDYVCSAREFASYWSLLLLHQEKSDSQFLFVSANQTNFFAFLEHPPCLVLLHEAFFFIGKAQSAKSIVNRFIDGGR